MSQEQHLEPNYRLYQNPIQLHTRVQRPVPRQQAHQAVAVQRLPTLSIDYQSRPLPPIPSPVRDHNVSSRVSGLIIRQSPRTYNTSLLEEHEVFAHTRGVHTSINRRRPTVVSRLIILIRAFFFDYIVEWWLLEIASLCFSAVCMSTIFWVMVLYNGKEIPHWPLGITFNGFISVFSVCAKASLIFPTAECIGQLKWSHFKENTGPMMDFERIDLASRGPWGALLLLGRFLGRTKKT